ncbi:MAG: ankyrin repeat domain-containing protein, partial [Alphaproteobacteria bacterium]|nr:ankyrin repeat domain-containing protein [Alphaproteobacteria bacterium]
QGEYDIADMLIGGGSDLNHQNRQGQTPLMLAAAKGHFELVQLLLRAGADVNIQDFTGRGALGWARGGRDRRIEMALEDAGARD